MKPGNVLVPGCGGREHALIDPLVRSPHCGTVFYTGENAGLADIAAKIHVAPSDIPGLIEFAKNNDVSLTVIGGESQLFEGIVDAFEEQGLTIFGPRKAVATIEESKAVAKVVMDGFGIPNAKHDVCTDFDAAMRAAEARHGRCYVKADGPALGKGAIRCENMEQAESAIRDCLINEVFGTAGKLIVIEDLLDGYEISAQAICDSRNHIMLPFSQDHKREFDFDQGLNTGGMGTVCDDKLLSYGLGKMLESYTERLLEGISVKTEVAYRGAIFPGVMISEQGPRILEVNARFGDPETQSVFVRLKSDLYELLYAAATDRLEDVKVEWHEHSSATVMMVSGGYPGSYKSGFVIKGLEEAKKLPNVKIFHSGTRLIDGNAVTKGGRVLGVTGTGPTLAAAIAGAYNGVSKIHFEGARYRKDIGARALKLVEANTGT